jgi:putative membrane protein insertion efficiency factor
MIRRAVWAAAAPVRALEIGLIHVYRATLSGWLGGQCRFYPTCSHYAEDAIRERGAFRGTAMAAWRILRCNPFGAGGIDHVRSGEQYDDITRHTRRPSTHGAEA